MAVASATLLGIHGGAAVALAASAVLLPAPLVIAAALVWVLLTCRFVEAHGRRVLIRTFGTNDVSLASGAQLVFFPQYVVNDSEQFGPWQKHRALPLPGQILEVDVPEVLATVENGLYCLKVNTKVVGVVQKYSVAELLQNRIAIEHRILDAIATTLRGAVYDLKLEEALVEIQRLFAKDASGISAAIQVPAFKVTQLMLDPNQSIVAADSATETTMQIIFERKQETSRLAILEASMASEEQKVKLHRVGLQAIRDEMMLQQEVYGKEGAAMVAAAKHANAVYLCVGGGAPTGAPWIRVEGADRTDQ